MATVGRHNLSQGTLLGHSILTADTVSPATKQHAFGSTSMYVGGQGRTHAVLTIFTVACVKYAVLGDKISGSQAPRSPSVLYCLFNFPGNISQTPAKAWTCGFPGRATL